MTEITRDIIQELIHLNSYRKTQGPMQAAHEALFRAKALEVAEGLIQAAVEREELKSRLAVVEEGMKEAVEALNDIKSAVLGATHS